MEEVKIYTFMSSEEEARVCCTEIKYIERELKLHWEVTGHNPYLCFCADLTESLWLRDRFKERLFDLLPNAIDDNGNRG